MDKTLSENHIEHIHTDANHDDFKKLVSLLDDYYYERFGEIALKYRSYNVIENNQDVCIIYYDGYPAACGCFKKYSEYTAEIKRIYVLPEYRKNGLASRVIEFCETEAKKQGYKKMVLETGIEMTDAISLYCKLGYSKIKNYGDFSGDELCICMEKGL